MVLISFFYQKHTLKPNFAAIPAGSKFIASLSHKTFEIKIFVIYLLLHMAGSTTCLL